MMRLCEFEENFWRAILPESEHKPHQSPGEKEVCPNCQLEKLFGQLSAFESMMLEWYASFSSDFLIQSGIAAEEWKMLPFESDGDRRVGASIISLIHSTREKISAEKMTEAQRG